MNIHQINRANEVKKALQQAGLSGLPLQFALMQIAHETGGFNSRIFNTHNNASGIKYINRPLIQGNASKGDISPERNHYAKFDSLLSWARDYMRILKNNKARPLSANDTADFAARLKQGGFYTDTLSNYGKGMLAWKATLKKHGLINDSGMQGFMLSAVVLAILFISLLKYKL